MRTTTTTTTTVDRAQDHQQLSGMESPKKVSQSSNISSSSDKIEPLKVDGVEEEESVENPKFFGGTNTPPLRRSSSNDLNTPKAVTNNNNNNNHNNEHLEAAEAPADRQEIGSSASAPQDSPQIQNSSSPSSISTNTKFSNPLKNGIGQLLSGIRSSSSRIRQNSEPTSAPPYVKTFTTDRHQQPALSLLTNRAKDSAESVVENYNNPPTSSSPWLSSSSKQQQQQQQQKAAQAAAAAAAAVKANQSDPSGLCNDFGGDLKVILNLASDDDDDDDLPRIIGGNNKFDRLLSDSSSSATRNSNRKVRKYYRRQSDLIKSYRADDEVVELFAAAQQHQQHQQHQQNQHPQQQHQQHPQHQHPQQHPHQQLPQHQPQQQYQHIPLITAVPVAAENDGLHSAAPDSDNLFLHQQQLSTIISGAIISEEEEEEEEEEDDGTENTLIIPMTSDDNAANDNNKGKNLELDRASGHRKRNVHSGVGSSSLPLPAPEDDEVGNNSKDRPKKVGHRERLLGKASLAVNVILLIIKTIAVVLSGSLSIISSLVDSAVDITSGLVVWQTSRAIKNRDPYLYPRGRTRLEPLALIIISVVMAVASILMIIESIEAIISGDVRPDVEWPTIGIMIATIIAKMILAILCRLWGEGSPSIGVLAQDHRNDCVSNFVAILCAFLADEYWPYLDPLGAIVVSLYIALTWFYTGYGQMMVLSGRSAKPAFINRIIKICLEHDDRIVSMDTVYVYHYGTQFLVEVHIVMDRATTLETVHDISEPLQQKIEHLPFVERAFVHVDYETEHRPETEHKVV